MASYLWYPVFEEEMREQFNTLSLSDKKGFFAKMEELLSAEEPYLIGGVEALQDKRFRDSRRIRKGDYRLRFKTEPGTITIGKFTYKGKLIFISIKNRRDAYR